MASKMNEFQAIAPATDFHERLANAVLKFIDTISEKTLRSTVTLTGYFYNFLQNN